MYITFPIQADKELRCEHIEKAYVAFSGMVSRRHDNQITIAAIGAFPIQKTNILDLADELVRNKIPFQFFPDACEFFKD